MKKIIGSSFIKLCLLCFMYLSTPPPTAWAVGEASTRFNFFVPPNNENINRDVALIVTAVTGAAGETTTVNIVDDNSDGDNDDSVSNIALKRGQSYILYIKDGAVNDDAGGKADGDYFQITSDRLVVVQMSTKSNWQHDWAPASNKKMLGREFYLYSPASSGADADINAFAYSDDTRVVIYDITTTAKTTTGTTTVSFGNATKILEKTLAEGEDLLHRNNSVSANLLQTGRTYYVQASKPITIVYGHLAGLVSNENSPRDGGGYVPSSNGSSVGDLFYFSIAHNPGLEREKELRIVSYDANNSLVLYGWSATMSSWQQIDTTTLQANEHWDLVGANHATFQSYSLYKLQGTAGKKISAFEANWLETGSAGTSDIASSVSSSDGSGAGKLFIAYMGPPGHQGNTTQGGTYSHLFIFGHKSGTTVSIKDTDTGGTLLTQSCSLGVDEYCQVKLDETQWNTLNTSGRRPYLTVTSNYPIAVLSTNWNDNWMTYATSVLLPSPSVTLTGAAALGCGQSSSYTLTTNNTSGGNFSTTSTVVTLPEGLSYVSTSGDLGTSPTVQTTSGVTTLTFSGYAQSSGVQLSQSVVVSATCLDGQGATLPSGHTASLNILSGGTYDGDTYSSQESLPITLIGSNALGTISASSGNGQITAQWTTTKESSNQGFAVLRSTSLTGTYSQINPTLVASQGDTTTGHSYQYVDTTATLNTLYYYKVELRPTIGDAFRIGPATAKAVDLTAPHAPSATAVAGASQITVAASGGNNDGDLSGYRIYRSTASGGLYILMNNTLTTSPYVDTNVINGTTYYYKVTAVDQAGNESAFSDTVSATPTVSANASTYLVAFEDARGSGSNDWDYNDFATRIYTSFTVNGSEQVTSITIHIEALSRGASYIHQFWMRVPQISGEHTYNLAMYDAPGGNQIATSSGSGTGPANVKIWEDTKTALPQAHSGTYSFATNTSPDQSSHTQGQAATLTITLSSPQDNPINNMASAPFDPYLKLTYISGSPEIHRIDYDPTSQEVVDTAVYSNSALFGSNLDFVIVIPENNTNFWRWPKEVVPVWSAYSSFVSFILSGQSTHTDWYLSPQTDNTWQYYNAP